MSKYGVISGMYFPVFGLNSEIYSEIFIFSPNTGKCGPEITPYLDTFHAVLRKAIITRSRLMNNLDRKNYIITHITYKKQ